MKKKQLILYLKTVALFVILAALVYACTKDYSQSDLRNSKRKNNKELSTSVAKQWFDSNNAPILELNFGNQQDMALKSSTNSEIRKTPTLVKPNWNKAKEKSSGNIEVVEVPLSSKGNVFFMDSETKNRKNESPHSKNFKNIARLVVHKDLSTGNVRSFIMIFIGTYNYLNNGNISKNSYLKRDPNFEGDVMFYTLDGNLINGWRYRNKKVVGRITPTIKSSVKTAANGKKAGRSGYYSCYTDTKYVERQICEREESVETDDEFGMIPIITVNCYTVEEPESIEVCEWVENEDDDDYGPGNPGYVDPNPPTGSTTSATNHLAVAPVESIDLPTRLNCFSSVPTNSSTIYKITIHVHSAHQGYPTHEYWGSDPGHAYITLEKKNGSNQQTLSFGFYPKQDTWVTPTKNGVASGIGEESANPTRRSDIRMTKSLTNAEFTAAIGSASSNSAKPYDLNDYNCTDFAIDVFNASQSGSNKLSVPNSNIGFTTPAGLYNTLDNLRIGGNTNISNVGGKPPVSTNCN